MAAIFCVQLVSGYDDFSALGIYACIMIMNVTRLLILTFGFQMIVLTKLLLILK